jgi:hypothetical protein
MARHSPDLPTQIGGQLNPAWVEWLMGVPIGWTSLDPLPVAQYEDWLASRDTWWQVEPDIPWVAKGVKDRVNRLKALGNGIVPAVVGRFLA